MDKATRKTIERLDARRIQHAQNCTALIQELGAPNVLSLLSLKFDVLTTTLFGPIATHADGSLDMDGDIDVRRLEFETTFQAKMEEWLRSVKDQLEQQVQEGRVMRVPAGLEIGRPGMKLPDPPNG